MVASSSAYVCIFSVAFSLWTINDVLSQLVAHHAVNILAGLALAPSVGWFWKGFELIYLMCGYVLGQQGECS